MPFVYSRPTKVTKSKPLVVIKYNPHHDNRGRFASGGASAFFNSGGTISGPLTEDSEELVKAQKDMASMSEDMGDEFKKDKGVEFTNLALNENEIHAKVKVAYAEDGIAGAIQYAHLPEEMANDMFGFSMGEDVELPELPAETYISYLGSTGIIDKTGTALAMSVIQEAAKAKTGVLLESADNNSTSFWKTLGFQEITPTLLHLTPEQVQEKAKS